jgi:PadR family transcriptional regulator
MPKGDALGPMEQWVLLAVIRLADEAYGMTVRREIEAHTGKPTSLGAVYATLDRLEAKGYVTSSDASGTPERAGRAKRFFRVERRGEKALRASLDAVDRLRAGLRLSRAPRGARG